MFPFKGGSAISFLMKRDRTVCLTVHPLINERTVMQTVLAHFIKKEIVIQPLNENNLGIFSLDPLDQDEITMIIFFCISVLMPLFNIDNQY